MKKIIRTLFIGGITLGLLAFVANLICAIIFHGENGTNIFTAISGWISGVATFFVGIIAYRQSLRYKLEAEEKERFVDVIVEKVEVVNHLLPNNVLGRKCVPKDVNLIGYYRFFITIYAFQENPIFDAIIERTIKDGAPLVSYDSVQPIQKGDHKRSFFCKNEFMQLTAEIPKDDNFNGEYQLILQFKNQYGDFFQKEIFVSLRSNFIGKVAKISQGKTKLVKKEQSNGQA